MTSDHDVEVSHDFVGGVPLSYVTTMLSLVSIGLMELEIMAFVVSVPISIPMPSVSNANVYKCLFCYTAKGPLSNFIPILYVESLMLCKKAVYNGLSLELNINFDFDLRVIGALFFFQF